MTTRAMRYHHYRMWDRIACRILETHIPVDIPKMKKEYISALGCKLKTSRDCFMCEYVYNNSSIGDITPCINCPSRLQFMHYRGCLSGLYRTCDKTKEWLTQYTISCLIRDSWSEYV